MVFSRNKLTLEPSLRHRINQDECQQTKDFFVYLGLEFANFVKFGSNEIQKENIRFGFYKSSLG